MARLTNDERDFIANHFIQAKATLEAEFSGATNINEVRGIVQTLDTMDTIITKMAPKTVDPADG